TRVGGEGVGERTVAAAGAGAGRGGLSTKAPIETSAAVTPVTMIHGRWLFFREVGSEGGALESNPSRTVAISDIDWGRRSAALSRQRSTRVRKGSGTVSPPAVVWGTGAGGSWSTRWNSSVTRRDGSMGKRPVRARNSTTPSA